MDHSAADVKPYFDFISLGIVHRTLATLQFQLIQCLAFTPWSSAAEQDSSVTKVSYWEKGDYSQTSAALRHCDGCMRWLVELGPKS